MIYDSIILRKLAFRQKRRSLDSGHQMKLQGTPKPGVIHAIQGRNPSNGHDRQRTPKKRVSTCISTSSLRGNWTMRSSYFVFICVCGCLLQCAYMSKQSGLFFQNSPKKRIQEFPNIQHHGSHGFPKHIPTKSSNSCI